jgi:hypothetical protein
MTYLSAKSVRAKLDVKRTRAYAIMHEVGRWRRGSLRHVGGSLRVCAAALAAWLEAECPALHVSDFVAGFGGAGTTTPRAGASRRHAVRATAERPSASPLSLSDGPLVLPTYPRRRPHAAV